MQGGLAVRAKSTVFLFFFFFCTEQAFKKALNQVYPHPTVTQHVALRTAWVTAFLYTP